MKKLLLLLLPALALAIYACHSEDSEEWPAPQISGVTTDFNGKAVPGASVVINGRNFSSKPSENKVLYGVGLESKSIEVTESSESHVKFIAPDISDGQLTIRVSTRGKESNQFVLIFDSSLAPEPEVDLSEILDNATKKTIREGVEWISFHGYWEGQIRNINIVKTTLNEHNRLGLYYDYKSEPDGYNIDDKCEYLDALVGTNGPMACCHFVRVNGVVKRVANEQDPVTNNCALTIDDGVPDIVKVADNFAAAKLPNQNVGCAGPLLVYEGRIQKYDFAHDFLDTTHPRTAFGITQDQKTVVQVAVDGRWTSGPVEQRAIGLPTNLLAKLMKGLGCYKALNFDGGGGTAMWIYEQGVNGIVNHPCDKPMNWDNPTLRPAGNAVYIVSDLK